MYLQAIDHIINSAAKTYYMSAGQISVPIVFRGPNGAAAGVAAQHSQVYLFGFFCKRRVPNISKPNTNFGYYQTVKLMNTKPLTML